ncbi:MULTISPECIES: OmpA family protein [unclassified Acinetobacter]|jgi:OOP family OmpA-OmpF porin|uniref:OmpA family protein n=1 Tax=Acinetobacter sp. A1-4-2 TaxID=3156489 RepID=A0AAU7SVJ6_9GAMM|nr:MULTISPECIES: OmpA family protein [unclassified Acinetobacter]MDD2946404.1 OmpA family protein [Acinetobacter sp.]OTG69788.1 hypothetical protein B9T38_14505 [Acinetobacter sp. ANC 4218]
MKQKLIMTCVASALLSLTACASLQNVDNKWCPPVEAAPAPVVVPPAPVQMERVELSADALFKFDRSTVADLLPEGRRQLDELASRISNGYVRIEQIRITGHTDRLGSESYNQRLGLARATTVKDYLMSQGVNVAMEVASAGESQPKTTSCVGNKATATLIACLQPDRRVEVDVTGVKKAE